MLTFLSFIIVIGVLIFVHELGHFLFAKLFDVGVEKFSLGFGPKILGKKYGETEYLISAFPLGGYVKMVGENEESEISPEDKARSFSEKGPLKRIAIVAAGPIFNLLFAYLVFITVFMIGVPSPTTRIGEVMEGKPAARAGIKTGDRVVSVNGKPVARWDDFAKTIVESKGLPLTIEVMRGSAPLYFKVAPESRTAKNLLGDMKLVERAIPLDTIGGPIMIARMAGQQAAAGGVSFLAFMALLSVNLGVLNLLPVPILDGGHLVFYLWELVFRKPVGMRAREIAQQIGLMLLIALMVLAFYNDIARNWNDIAKFFLGK